MNIEELIEAISSGQTTEIIEAFLADDQLMSKLKITFKDTIEYHKDDGLPWTQLDRTYMLEFKNQPLYTWWEKYYGYYGGAGTGWWVENVDADGPKQSAEVFIEKLSLKIPDVTVPRPK